MITIKGSRNDGFEDHAFPAREADIVSAMYSLLRHELRFGGQIANASPTSVAIRTQVFGKTDTTVFSGTKEEMLPLFEAISLYMLSNRTIEDASEWVVNVVGDGKRVSPLLATAFAPLAVSGDVDGSKSKMIVAGIVLGEDRIEHLQQAVSVPDSDFVSAMQLIRDGEDPSEVFA